MKFGKYLASRQLELPEYAGHFIDYKALKKLIKQLASPVNGKSQDGTHGQNSMDMHSILKENKASFFFRVERELDKVNMFYLEKQANLEMTLDLLIIKKNELFLKSRDILVQQNSSTFESSSNSNFRNSITFLNLYQNFKKLHQDLVRLQQFIELNETGFSKVVKKWDKRSKSHTKELFIQTAVNVQPVFHKSEINMLSDLVAQSLMDLESVLDGDYSSILNSHLQEGIISTSQVAFSDIEGEEPNSQERNNSVSSTFNFHAVRRGSLQNPNSDIDELYSGFVNVATLKDPDFSLLARWLEKAKSTSKLSSSDPLDEATKYKLSKVFLLAISNVKISDSFLKSFLEFIDYSINFCFVSQDFKRNIFHECCSIPTTSTHHHVTINNGLKVVNSTDSINHSRMEILEYVLHNLDPDQRDSLLVGHDFNGRSCLHYAAQNNKLDFINMVSNVYPKEHIDDLDKESMSALILAIKYRHFEAIEMLVKLGSDCFPKSDETKLQYLPINYACKIGDYRILEYLLSYSKPDNSFVNQQDVEGLLPLHVISRAGNYKLINLLIQYGADVNRYDSLNKWPPVFYAASEGHVKTALELVKYNARLDLVDENGYNVLYYCVIEGHIHVLNELLRYRKDIYHENEKESLQLGMEIEDPSCQGNELGDMRNSIFDADEDSGDSGNLETIQTDTIPDLHLPPPVLPLRRYGHNFLEQKVLIELIFPKDVQFIRLFDFSSNMKPGRITITSNITDIVPRNILLPMANEKHTYTSCIFQTDIESLSDFKIDFEIFPTFGSRLMAKTTVLDFSQRDSYYSEIRPMVLPLFDLRLRNIGELEFRYHIIFPFGGNLLEASKFDTYWKSSTSLMKDTKIKHNAAGGLSPNNFLLASTSSRNSNNHITTTQTHPHESVPTPSFVTATSLAGDYLRVRVCMINDGTAVICPQWNIAISEHINLYLPNMSMEQLKSITDSLFDYESVLSDLSQMTANEMVYIKKLLQILYLPLNVFLNALDVSVNISLEIIYPCPYEFRFLPLVGNIPQNLNKFIDSILEDIFNHVRSSKVKNLHANGRAIIFSSSNSSICKMLNWKQPNYPVFLCMDSVVYDSKETRFQLRSSNGLLEDPTLRLNDGSLAANSIQETLTRSIKEAVHFSINNNLMGVVISIYLLKLVPKLIPLIRSGGLVLVASDDTYNEDYSNDEQDNVSSIEKLEINGLRVSDVVVFKEDVNI